MYGMIPSAKTDRLLKAPPANISKSPSRDPFACAKKAASAVVSIPGVVTWAPIRYTISIMKVNSIRFCSSGIFEIFFKPPNKSVHLDNRPAGGFNFHPRALADHIHLHVKGIINRPLTQ